MIEPDVNFRPLQRADFPLLRRWLGEPHIRDWWGDPPSPEEMERKYGPRVDGTDPTRAYIVYLAGRPIGYLQAYRLEDYPEYAEALQVDGVAAGVDLFIGEPSLLHQGLGAPMLVQFVRTVVFADSAVERCVLGPSVKNRAAIRCYEKAGFRFLKEVHVPGETYPEYVMSAERQDLNWHAAPAAAPVRG